MPYIFTGLVYIAAFAVAGIFSSRIASTNSEVLLQPIENCGLWSYPHLHLFDPSRETWEEFSAQQLRYYSNQQRLIKQSHAYLSECHKSDATDETSASCLPYGRMPISWNRTAVACPFDDMCLVDAMRFDTGFLDSSHHFGIGSKHDHIAYRRVMTCAPITTEGHVSGYVTASRLNFVPGLGNVPYEGETFRKYAYGQSFIFEDNSTFAFSNLSWGVSPGYNYPFEIYHLEYVLFFPFARC
jgi:hypothetical protein